MGGTEAAYRRVQAGDRDAFAAWTRVAEPWLRRGLRPFARQVDVESVVQETLLRMWVIAPRLRLEGPRASLRYAGRIARNLALEECRRRRIELLEPDDPPETAAPADPLPDPGLRAAIARCLKRLTPRPRRALLARLEARGGDSDRELAARAGMRLNTFLQNVGRARRQMARCLERHGVPVGELMR
ncbi:MAG: RNA polymerase sigma factor [Acidobacteria bacterium]|nr:MAG: RNA polymerase sigma factor [Acidobacteriota bacterium]